MSNATEAAPTMEEIIAYLAAHIDIRETDSCYPSFNDKRILDAATALLSPGDPISYPFRLRALKKGRILEMIPTVGMGVTLCGWSDRHPYEVIGITSDKCLDIRAMKAEGGLKKDAKVSVGGFCAHVHDQREAQEWTLSSDESQPVVRIRLGARGWKDAAGQTYSVGRAIKFHDYNF